MLSTKSKFLLVLMDAAKKPFFEEEMILVPSKLKPPFDQYFYEIYKDLGGHGPAATLSFEYHLLGNPGVLISLDEELQFHRYRLETLKHTFYETHSNFSVSDYKRFAHNHEKDALKKGLQNGFWSHKEAEKHFGNSSEPGDFYANGSPGWKWEALKATVLDLYCEQAKIKLIRIPIYQAVMIKGQLYTFGKLFDSRQEESTRYITRFVERQIPLIPETNTKQQPERI
jgi:hypothetical protein